MLGWLYTKLENKAQGIKYYKPRSTTALRRPM